MPQASEVSVVTADFESKAAMGELDSASCRQQTTTTILDGFDTEPVASLRRRYGFALSMALGGPPLGCVRRLGMLQIL